MRRLGTTPADLAQAAAILRQGGLTAFPTETVYGLGADACNSDAVARIYAAKGRPSFNPLIAHVADLAGAQALVNFTPDAMRLADVFWPGALTLVLPLRADAGVSTLVTAGLSTLAIRVPDHPVAQGILRHFAGPVAAPSANPSGRISPTTAAHVVAGLSGKIDALVDGGACSVGVESTIVDMTGPPALMRAGGIPVEVLEAALGKKLVLPGDQAAPASPGQLASHYAPLGVMRLNAITKKPDEVMLGFGAVPGDLTLSASGDLLEAASRLFDCLHQLDAMGAMRIAVAPVPLTGLGLAINDRLQRAAAPRD